MEKFTTKQPSKGLYIFVWILNGIIGTVVVQAIDTALAEVMYNNAKSINDIWVRMFLGIAFQFVVVLIISILVYSYFKELKISKVMPYIYILWTLGVLATYSQLSSEFADLDVSTAPLALSYAVGWAIAVLGFRFYFRNKDNW